ncbi:hypothetical protein [Streptomyces sp. NPDC055036]
MTATRCPGGGHDFPIEDEDGARCEEHGFTLLWNGPPITEDEFPSTPGAPVPCGPWLAARLFDLSSPHRCLGRSIARHPRDGPVPHVPARLPRRRGHR